MSDAVSLREARGLCEDMRRRASSPSNEDVRESLGAAVGVMLPAVAGVMPVMRFSAVLSSAEVEEEDAACGVSSWICGEVVLWKSKSDSSEIFSSGIDSVVTSRWKLAPAAVG